jgi:hypothetical protein
VQNEYLQLKELYTCKIQTTYKLLKNIINKQFLAHFSDIDSCLCGSRLEKQKPYIYIIALPIDAEKIRANQENTLERIATEGS